MLGLGGGCDYITLHHILYNVNSAFRQSGPDKHLLISHCPEHLCHAGHPTALHRHSTAQNQQAGGLVCVGGVQVPEQSGCQVAVQGRADRAGGEDSRNVYQGR